MKRARLSPWFLLLALMGCATPMTQIGNVSREQVQAERFKEQQLVIQGMVDDKRRLDDVSYSLLKAAAPLCPDAVTTRLGVSVINRSSFDDLYLEAARSLGYTDTLELETVAKGSGADRAGLRARDRILALNGETLPRGSDAPEQFAARAGRTQSAVVFTYLRDSVVRSVSVPRDPVCDFEVVSSSDPNIAMNAVSIGRRIVVSTSLMHLVADENELATVVGHEIAHSAMHHTDAKQKNAVLGALAGLVVDLALLKGGVNTGGQYSNDFAKIGAIAFSQDFEREADYVGLNILAASGRPTSAAPAFWRRMAQENPGSITFATTHPTTAERYVRLDQWGREIDKQITAGQPLRLAMKDGSKSAPLPMLKGAAPDATATGPRVLAQSSPATTSPAPRSAAASSPAKAAGLSASARELANTPPIVRQSGAASPAPRSPSVPSRILRSDSTVAVAVIGAPQSDSARAAAVGAYAVGRLYFDRHEWGRAEDWFRQTLLLDGSLASYHAALGSVEIVLEKWEEAEAEYTAALMLDLSNQEYRAQILEARRRKGR